MKKFDEGCAHLVTSVFHCFTRHRASALGENRRGAVQQLLRSAACSDAAAESGQAIRDAYRNRSQNHRDYSRFAKICLLFDAHRDWS